MSVPSVNPDEHIDGPASSDGRAAYSKEGVDLTQLRQARAKTPREQLEAMASLYNQFELMRRASQVERTR